MVKPKKQSKQLVKKATVSKKISKGNKNKQAKKQLKNVRKPGKRLAKNKPIKRVDYDSNSDFSGSESEHTPYDEETSNPISESESKKSWTDDEIKPKKLKKKQPHHGPSKASIKQQPSAVNSQAPLTLKQQAEKKWDSKIKKWLEMKPFQAKEEVEEMKLSLQDKLELGNELTAYVKKIQKIGEEKTTYVYSNAQLSEYNKLKGLLATKTVKELQEELVKNDQPKTDVKAAVLERVLDGRILGKIPKCPQCFGGRLRFNNSTGLYICPGYVDGGDNCVKGDDYIFCFERYLPILIQRETWQS